MSSSFHAPTALQIYEQYCRQSLMQHKSFRAVDDLAGYTTFTEEYAAFLQSGSVPTSFEDDIHRLQQHSDSNPTQQRYMCMHTYSANTRP